MCVARWPAELLKCNSLTRRGMLFRRCHSSSRREKQSRLMLTGSRRLRAGWRIGRQPLALQQHNRHSPQPPTGRQWSRASCGFTYSHLPSVASLSFTALIAHTRVGCGLIVLWSVLRQRKCRSSFSRRKSRNAARAAGPHCGARCATSRCEAAKRRVSLDGPKAPALGGILNAIMQWQAVAGQ